MVEEFAVLGGPSYLHDSGGVEGDLVIPLPRVACAEGGTNTLEGGGVAPAQQTRSTHYRMITNFIFFNK